MRQANPTVQRLVRLLLHFEAGGSQDAETLVDATERACDKLRLHLTKLMGADGFTLLLVRALTFSRAEFPWLAEIRAERDGSLKNLHAAAEGVPVAEVGPGLVAVLHHFFGLLVTFIGDDMTLRLVQGAWPDVDLGGKDLGLEETT